MSTFIVQLFLENNSQFAMQSMPRVTDQNNNPNQKPEQYIRNGIP